MMEVKARCGLEAAESAPLPCARFGAGSLPVQAPRRPLFAECGLRRGGPL